MQRSIIATPPIAGLTEPASSHPASAAAFGDRQGYHHVQEYSRMKQRFPHRLVRDILERLKRFFRREPESPDDPYALVGAPKKPGPPHRSAGATVDLE
jgi:hypothetical protein